MKARKSVRIPTNLKITAVTILSVLALVVGMLSSSGTASAQTQSALRVNPRISISSAFQFGTQCVALRINGRDFTPSTRNRSNFAELFVFGTRGFGAGRAFTFRFNRFVVIDRNGRFANRQATVCGRFFRIGNVCAQAEDERSGRFSNVACVRFNNRRPFGFS